MGFDATVCDIFEGLPTLTLVRWVDLFYGWHFVPGGLDPFGNQLGPRKKEKLGPTKENCAPGEKESGLCLGVGGYTCRLPAY